MQPPKNDKIVNIDWSEKSSIVERTVYNKETRQLEIVFKKTGAYIYLGVPIEVWNNLVKAESVGKFINSEIKSNYAYNKIY